ncbi:hypothetical protein DDV96_07255 [Marixanthomonas spongiae]|uniref:Uncharacterized protein n=1 Tax=Marixanthomonas spongiae TaxID=2174845 RepID=A0A2U0I260_9FLAO|nr:hypothetical protein DDV96_07255 [Marixanthomonas spongiae]
MYMRPQIVFIVSLALSLFSNVAGFGQSISERSGPPTPPPPGPPPPGLSVDNNILLLIAIGLMLGIYFLIKKYRSNDIPA